MKKFFSLLLVIAVSTGIVSADSVSGKCGNNLKWKFEDNVLTISGTGDMYDYENSTYVPWFSFQHLITYIDIESGVKSIGKHAFAGCAFITSITIPNSVKLIGDYAFADCTSLEGLEFIGDGITSMGECVFYGCSSITYPVYTSRVFAYLPESYSGAYTIPDGIQSIAAGAFYDCKGLTDITIPNSVKSIGRRAFWGCRGLTSITIPNSVKSIGDIIFASCKNLTSIVVENGNTTYDSRDNCNAIIKIASNTLVAGCKETIIPNSVKSIGDSAFYSCSGMTSIAIPNSVTRIGNHTFYGCKDLTSVTIGNNVTGIGEYAFSYCDLLTSIEIPNSVTSIGNRAFEGCTGLPVVDNIRYADTYLVKAVDNSLSSYTIKEGTKWIGSTAFYRCIGLTSIDIPNSVKSIGDYAFYECSNLNSLTIGNSVTSIGMAAFSSCTGLTSITCHAITPPSIRYDVFDKVECYSIPLYVPNESMEQYQSTDIWKNFKIRPLNPYNCMVDATATHGEVIGSGEYEVYTNAVLTVIPDNGYIFVQWSDGDTHNPRTIYVTRDIVMNAICEPIPANSLPYNESFASSIGDFSIKDVNLDGIDYVWKWASANYGMKASAYVNNKSHATESWLISPAISLQNATDIVLAFEHAVNKGATNNLRVKISTDWGTSWNDLNVQNWPAGTNWNFISTSLSLNAYADKIVQIAFVYKSSSSICPTWEIKNFSVTGTIIQPLDVESVSEENNLSATKLLRNNQLLILRGDKTYTLQGQEVR